MARISNNSASRPLKTGTLAKRAGVNLQTVLYYERRGLLKPARRSPAGHRLYGPETVERILFVKNAQTLGFTLDQILKLVTWQSRQNAACAPVHKRARLQLEQTRRELKALRSRETTLARLVDKCRRDSRVKDCAFLKYLSTEALS